MNDPSTPHMARQLTVPSCDQLTAELCLSGLCKINTAAGRLLITGEESYVNIIPKGRMVGDWPTGKILEFRWSPQYHPGSV